MASTKEPSSLLWSFPKLEGISNYETWKFHIKTALIHQELWDTVIKDAPSESSTEYNKWLKLNNKAYTFILLTIKDKLA